MSELLECTSVSATVLIFFTKGEGEVEAESYPKLFSTCVFFILVSGNTTQFNVSSGHTIS